jgi:hypothetical protein
MQDEPKPVVVAIASPGTVQSQVVATPHGEPNIVIQAVRPIAAIAIRFANAFATAWVGLILAAMTPVGGKLLYTGDFLHAAAVCASLAFPGAAVSAAKDLVTIFGKLEGKYPLLTGGV